MGSSLKIIFDHFFRISVFWLLLLRVFSFSSKLSYIFVFFLCVFVFCFFLCFFFFLKRSMKIITGRRHWVLTEESPRLTTMDDNNILKHFGNAPLTKMIVSSLIVFLLGDNVIKKVNHLASIQYKNHNAVAHGCRDIVKILRPSQF